MFPFEMAPACGFVVNGAVFQRSERFLSATEVYRHMTLCGKVKGKIRGRHWGGNRMP